MKPISKETCNNILSLLNNGLLLHKIAAQLGVSHATIDRIHEKLRTDIQKSRQHVKGTVKFGGGSLMIWGCMTAQGVGYACRIDGNMNAELYTCILEDEFLQSLEYYGMEVDKVIFQQDNDPKHTSHTAQKWFKDNGVEVLDWPAQSPDLNPIEHLWQHLKQRLATYETDPISMHELWERVEAEWNRIPPQICIDLITSMSRRVAAFLKAKGGYTKY